MPDPLEKGEKKMKGPHGIDDNQKGETGGWLTQSLILPWTSYMYGRRGLMNFIATNVVWQEKGEGKARASHIITFII
jgi:hypothetical protein